jgi:hypothetical protein
LQACVEVWSWYLPVWAQKDSSGGMGITKAEGGSRMLHGRQLEPGAQNLHAALALSSP